MQLKTHQDFNRELNEAINLALKSGIPRQVVIAELEISKLFVFDQYCGLIKSALVQQQQSADEKLADKISKAHVCTCKPEKVDEKCPLHALDKN